MMWVPSILPLPGCVHPLPPRLSRPRGAELENERSGCGEASKERARRDIGVTALFFLGSCKLGSGICTERWNFLEDNGKVEFSNTTVFSEEPLIQSNLLRRVH
ncbi:unnamed protein product [Triticum turgidum subsp. durum]|uniref:Uncharacterized protein n=1 Tax=Triticum turgidum subsp. durum TaxID=4567 RepID=A0A9R0ZLF7_TRITD|nr:unnamed protein product [Triticum turgidum subsp. durum]